MTRRGLIRIVFAASAAVLAFAGPAGAPTCVLAQGAEGASCRSTCLNQYNACRMHTKGAPVCDQQYQACLQGCLPQR